ncbi:hypothetical protein, conserved [Eimeria praecox]|uniref:Uncharacterized protein n=1 Tax=Eimeria praecox TaxID=51316 RepID=U6GXD8_9EIME|nr:hypothetical protein, conserved [Eimeria praecox]
MSLIYSEYSQLKRTVAAATQAHEVYVRVENQITDFLHSCFLRKAVESRLRLVRYFELSDAVAVLYKNNYDSSRRSEDLSADSNSNDSNDIDSSDDNSNSISVSDSSSNSNSSNSSRTSSSSHSSSRNNNNSSSSSNNNSANVETMIGDLVKGINSVEAYFRTHDAILSSSWSGTGLIDLTTSIEQVQDVQQQMLLKLQQNQQLAAAIVSAAPHIYRDGFAHIQSAYASFAAEAASIVQEYAAGVQRTAAALNSNGLLMRSRKRQQRQQEQQQQQEEGEEEYEEEEEEESPVMLSLRSSLEKLLRQGRRRRRRKPRDAEFAFIFREAAEAR